MLLRNSLLELKAMLKGGIKGKKGENDDGR